MRIRTPTPPRESKRPSNKIRMSALANASPTSLAPPALRSKSSMAEMSTTVLAAAILPDPKRTTRSLKRQTSSSSSVSSTSTGAGSTSPKKLARKSSQDDGRGSGGDSIESNEEQVEPNLKSSASNHVSLNKKMSSILEVLECPVCLEYPRTCTIFTCSNGHIVCADCKPGVKNSCPTCRDTTLTPDPFAGKIADRALKDLSMSCRFNVHGCTKKDIMENLGAHEERCQYREVHCPAKHRGACQWVGSLAKMISHVRDQGCIQVRILLNGYHYVSVIGIPLDKILGNWKIRGGDLYSLGSR